MSPTAVLPLFPLHTVLFPGGPLSLRIFEPRYVDMVGRSMREGSPFGVVLIQAGAEVGSEAEVEIADIGTTARIVDFSTLPDGLLGIHCLGERKFRVLKHSRQSDGLNVGEVLYAPAEKECAIPGEYLPLQQLLEQAWPKIKEVYSDVTPRFDDATWVGCRLAEVMPMDLGERVALLTLSDPIARLARLDALRS